MVLVNNLKACEEGQLHCCLGIYLVQLNSKGYTTVKCRRRTLEVNSINKAFKRLQKASSPLVYARCQRVKFIFITGIIRIQKQPSQYIKKNIINQKNILIFPIENIVSQICIFLSITNKKIYCHTLVNTFFQGNFVDCDWAINRASLVQLLAAGKDKLVALGAAQQRMTYRRCSCADPFAAFQLLRSVSIIGLQAYTFMDVIFILTSCSQHDIYTMQNVYVFFIQFFFSSATWRWGVQQAGVSGGGEKKLDVIERITLCLVAVN